MVIYLMSSVNKGLVFISLLLVSQLVFAQQDNRAAAILGDEIITYQQIISPIADEIYEAEQKIYELKLNQLKSQILARLIEKDPLSQGVSTDIFVQKYITKNPQVSDNEVDNFITERRVPAHRLTPEFRQQVKTYMLQQKRVTAIDGWIEKKGRKYGLSISLQPPERPRATIDVSGSPSIGPDNAPITIVEYSDFQCPYCAQAVPTVKKILKNYANKVRIVYKQFPLDFHKDAFRASEASLCINEQSNEGFWKLHDYMLANPRSLNQANLIEKATEYGANKNQFSQCLQSGKYANQVDREMQEGRAIGVSSTPMFFVNGISLKGAQPYSAFEQLIEEELARNTKK
jgi:protein-disulfide isomerase